MVVGYAVRIATIVAKSSDTLTIARENNTSCSPFPPPLTMLILTSLIATFAVNTVWGRGKDFEYYLNYNTKVIRNIHITKYKVCAFCVCFSKVSQRLLARIVVAVIKTEIQRLEKSHFMFNIYQ